MNAEEWADVILRGLDIVAWPLVVFGGFLFLRTRLPAVGTWFADLLGRRGFTATGPAGTSIRVERPGPDIVQRADEAVLEQLQASATDPASAQRLRALEAQLGELETSTDALAAAWEEANLVDPGVIAVRIAERFVAFKDDPSETDPGQVVSFFRRPEHNKPHYTFRGTPDDAALLMVAWLSTYKVQGAEYPDYLAAAERLRERGYEFTDPPFSPRDLAAISESGAVSFES